MSSFFDFMFVASLTLTIGLISFVFIYCAIKKVGN
jgi:hypothetical protein